jgi:hypothetical protein
MRLPVRAINRLRFFRATGNADNRWQLRQLVEGDAE